MLRLKDLSKADAASLAGSSWMRVCLPPASSPKQRSILSVGRYVAQAPVRGAAVVGELQPQSCPWGAPSHVGLVHCKPDSVLYLWAKGLVQCREVVSKIPFSEKQSKIKRACFCRPMVLRFITGNFRRPLLSQVLEFWFPLLAPS